MQHEETVNVLDSLTQTSVDGANGFAEAANEATRADLQKLFQKRSSDFASAATEFQHIVKSPSGTHEDRGTVSGAAHRGWAKIKATVGDANLGMLEEATRAEDRAKAAYMKALTADLPNQVRVVIQRQHDGAVLSYNFASDLRDSHSAETRA